MRSRWASGTGGVVLTFLLAATVFRSELATPGLGSTLPEVVPSVTGWERSSAGAEFAEPHHFVDYELYVSPERGGVYTVTRYRIAFSDPGERERRGISAAEKLQWDTNGRDVRRFECVGGEQAMDPCEWQELPYGSAAFERETWNLLLVYQLHRQFLRRQEEEQRGQ